MDSGNAIEVQNIKKDFKVFYDKGFQLKERLLFRKRNKYERRYNHFIKFTHCAFG